MARIAGRNGRIYVGLASASVAAESVAFIKKWNITFTTDDFEVTAMGDTNKTYVAGLPDCGGQFDGFFDDSTVQTYTAATDGIARKFYLYPSNTNTGQYWYGTAIFDFQADADVSGPVTMQGKFKAATAVTKVG